MGFPNSHPGKYSDEVKRNAVACFLATITPKRDKGNYTKAAKAANVDIRTMFNWKKSDWWDEMMAQVMDEATNPRAGDSTQAAALRASMKTLGEVIISMVNRVDQASEGLSARDCLTFLPKVISSYNTLGGDKESLEEELSRMPDEELERFLADALRRAAEMKEFGESSYRPERDGGSDVDTDNTP